MRMSAAPHAHIVARRARLDRLRAYLDEQRIDVALISRPEHLRYLTGWNGQAGPGYLVVGGTRALLVAPDGSLSSDVAAALSVETRAYQSYDAGRLCDVATAASELTARCVA